MSRIPIPPAHDPQGAADAALLDHEVERAQWQKERQRLLTMLAQQQRVAHTGLITAGLVHEVANYVTLISGSAYLAARSSDPAKWREVLGEIPTRCEEISETIRAVLAFAGRREDVDVESFRASELLRQAVHLLKPLAASEDVAVTYRVDGDAVLVGEQRLLVQALVNLGTNAVRACDGGPGRVQLSCALRQGRTCRIEVGDDGLGVPEYLRAKLFRPFVSGRGASGGSGLGLFIVRQAVRRMGGTIRVETSPDGTSVRLDLPATPPEAAV